METRNIFDARERDLAIVSRWTITRNIRQQNVAEHSFYVALWALRVGELLNWAPSELYVLVQRALHHDMSEVFSGDLPSPFKKTLGEAGKAETFNYLLKNNLATYPLTTSLDDQCDLIIKFCDLVEAIVKITEEQSMGNKTLDGCYEELLDKIRTIANQIDREYDLKAYELYFAVMAMISDTLNYQSGIVPKVPTPAPSTNHDDEVLF